MSTRVWFGVVGLVAMCAGTALWLLRPSARLISPPNAPVGIAPAALYATPFTDLQGHPQALGRFQGKVVVVNFWATWCAPCRDEMPAFDRLYTRWQARGVEIVGISAEEPATVASFASSVRVGYPLWTGGSEVNELSRRLGNHLGVLPHTALIGPRGEVLETRVGPYTESQLEARLLALSPNAR